MADNREHVFGANMKIAARAENSSFGNLGSARSMDAESLFPSDTTESLSKESVLKSRGQIGLNGNSVIPVTMGETVAGSIQGQCYFDSHPIWTLISAGLGCETTVSGYGDLYARNLCFGENFYNSDNSDGGTYNRHATVCVDAGIDYSGGSNNLVYQVQSFKPSTVEFSGNRDDGLMYTVTGNGYKVTREDIDSSSWDGREALADIVLLSNTCTTTFYINEYASNTTVSATIRPLDFTITFDQANEVRADAGSGIGIREPNFSPSGRKCTVSWTQEFGPDSTDYGVRDWTSQFEDATPIQILINIADSSGQTVQFMFPRGLLTAPGKPIVDGPDTIAMSYSADFYLAEESLTNSFAECTSYPGLIKLINDYNGQYLVATA